MSSPASILKHPFHPMLVPFPIGLWIFSLICDLIYLLGWGGEVWNDMAFYTMAGGVLGGLAAAVPGYIDYRSIVSSEPKRLGRTHMLLNLAIIALYIIDLLLRVNMPRNAGLPVVLSVIAVGLLGVAGWLGGELVYVHGVAVEGK